MLLAIDIGNTNISIGLFQKRALLHHWRLQTNTNSTTDEYSCAILDLFARDNFSIEKVQKVLVASVVPTLKETFLCMFDKIFQKPVEILTENMIPIVDVLYNRQEVGVDRLLNAYSGFQKYKEPLVIIDFGTAITFDIVGAKGQYLGGIIAPSIRVATEALSKQTAMLPKIDLQIPKKIIGKNTIESMHSGMFFGYIGMIDFCIEKIFEEQQKSCLVLATGGEADLFKKYSKIDKLEKELTLWGIYFVEQQNKK